MNTDFLDYKLPQDLIAQQPCPERDQSRLLVTRRTGRALEHRVFHDLPDLLSPRDLLVLNDTRVVPARLLGRRAATGGKWEGLFLQETPDGLWELLSQTRGRLLAGETILVESPAALACRLRAGLYHPAQRRIQTRLRRRRHGKTLGPGAPISKQANEGDLDFKRGQLVWHPVKADHADHAIDRYIGRRD